MEHDKSEETSKPVTHAAHAAHHTVEYQSNPFTASITGLMTMLKVNPVPSLLLGIVLGLIAFGAFFMSIFFLIIPFLGLLLVLAVMALVIPFMVGGLHALAVSSIHGESRKTEDFIGDAFKKLLPTLGACLLIGLIVGLGFMFFIIPGIIFASWFSLTFFAMFDENLGVTASMKRSKELVSGHMFEIIGAYLAGGLMSGATLGGGAGLLTPAISIAPMAARYQQLKALKASNQPKPELHWMNVVIAVVYGVFITSIVAFYSIVIAFSLLNTDLNNPDRFDQNSSFESRLEQQLKELEEQNKDYKTDYDYDYSPPSFTN